MNPLKFLLAVVRAIYTIVVNLSGSAEAVETVNDPRVMAARHARQGPASDGRSPSHESGIFAFAVKGRLVPGGDETVGTLNLRSGEALDLGKVGYEGQVKLKLECVALRSGHWSGMAAIRSSWSPPESSGR